MFFSGLDLLQQRPIHSCCHFEFQHGLIHGPQCFQRCTRCSVALPTTTVLSEENLLHTASLRAGVPPEAYLLWAPTWPDILRCCSMTLCTATDDSGCVAYPVWTYLWTTALSEISLMWHRHSHSHRCFKAHLLCRELPHSHICFGVSCSHTDSGPAHSPFSWSAHRSCSLASAAAQKQPCLGHLPAQTHHHCCYQSVPRHGRGS